MIDNLSIIISIVALGVSLLSNILMITRNIRDYKELKVSFNIIRKMELTLEPSEKIDFSRFNVEDYIKELLEKINRIYPKAIFNVSIKLIKSVDTEKPEESKLYTWFKFPQQMQNEQNLYTIKNNTDYRSLIENNGKFFFVSDLKKYSAFTNYKNESKNYLQRYNTVIVFPIRKKGRDKKYDIIGFLCVDSPQRLNNVKKNEKVISLVEMAASVIYDFLNQNKDKQEIYSIKQ
jgi:hypothetical protein